MIDRFDLPELPYAHDALEPHIDAKTMKIHHTKHHAGYAAKLNAALEKAGITGSPTVEELLSDLDSLPPNIRPAVRNNGGGYLNHTLFWNCMSPQGGGRPNGEIAKAIERTFGGFTEFQIVFSDTATGLFGSGWAWLVLNRAGDLRVTYTANQDSPIMEGETPLLGLDVWEHAYYLKHQNRRPDYVKAWWNVVDWEAVGARYDALALRSAVA